MKSIFTVYLSGIVLGLFWDRTINNKKSLFVPMEINKKCYNEIVSVNGNKCKGKDQAENEV